MEEAERANDPYGSGSQGGGSERQGSVEQDESGSSTEMLNKAKEQIEPGLDKAKEQLDAGMDRAKEQADAGMDKAADGLESAAERIKSMAGEGEGAPAQAGVKLAEGMESAATYLKEHSSNELLKDLEVFVKEHPTQALVGAIFAGFLVGRILR